MRLARFPSFNSPLDALQQFQSEMNHLFDGWNTGDGARGYAAAYPTINVWEEADAVYFEAELPGLDRKDLEIYVTGGNQVTIKGERKQPATPDKSVWHRQERGQGAFVRSLTLPTPVNPDKVEASLENGVLLVKLAKHEAAKPRKITVKS